MRTTFKASLLLLCLALWPALVAAQVPEPNGKLVYSEQFSDAANSGLEDNIDATDFQRGFHAPGVYHLKVLNNNDTRWVVVPNQSYGTFTLELDLWDNSDDLVRGDVQLGVVFRVEDEDHLYAVLLDPRKGQYAVRKLDGADQWSDLLPWTASELVNQQDVPNHLRVDGVGDTFTIYLNNERLDSVTDAAYSNGGIGMIASNVDAPTPHMHFDNLMIYAPEPTTQNTPADRSPAQLPDTGLAGGTMLLVLLWTGLLFVGLGLLVRQRQH